MLLSCFSKTLMGAERDLSFTVSTALSSGTSSPMRRRRFGRVSVCKGHQGHQHRVLEATHVWRPRPTS